MKFYFDMDGVLANFDSMVPNNSNLNHPSEDLSPEERIAKTQFWRKVEQTPNFWRDIPVMQNAEHMLSVAQNVGEIFILSKTPGAKHFITGDKYVEFVANEKRKWVLKHLNNFFDAEHIIICKTAKGALIHPTHTDILVDDRQENINEWIEQGGRGILFKNAIDTAHKIQSNEFVSNISLSNTR